METRQYKSFILPISTTFIIPFCLLFFSYQNHTISIFGINFFSFYIQLAFGAVIFLFGFFLLVKTIGLFINIGKGTLAPWDPTRKLVVVDIYKYTRNPMISGVLFMLLGESIILGSLSILIWCVLFFFVNQTYFILSEEPGLVKRFGDEYTAYKKNVPRWLPRLTPWENGNSS